MKKIKIESVSFLLSFFHFFFYTLNINKIVQIKIVRFHSYCNINCPIIEYIHL